MTWNTIARWLKVASDATQRFYDEKLKNFVIHELQADKIRTFSPNKKPNFPQNLSVLLGSNKQEFGRSVLHRPTRYLT